MPKTKYVWTEVDITKGRKVYFNGREEYDLGRLAIDSPNGYWAIRKLFPNRKPSRPPWEFPGLIIWDMVEFLNTNNFTPEIVGFDNYEIHGIRELDRGHIFTAAPVEQCEDCEAEWWCLFGHIPGQGLLSIADFVTRKKAEEMYGMITGKNYNEK